MIALGTLVAFAGTVIAAVAATIQWILAVANPEKRTTYRRRGSRLMLVALGLLLLAGALATLNLCCAPPN